MLTAEALVCSGTLLRAGQVPLIKLGSTVSPGTHVLIVVVEHTIYGGTGFKMLKSVGLHEICQALCTRNPFGLKNVVSRF